MAKSEKKWAAQSPVFTAGQQVYAYADNVPCKIVEPDPNYPGYWRVLVEDGADIIAAGKVVSLAWDNLALKPE